MVDVDPEAADAFLWSYPVAIEGDTVFLANRGLCSTHGLEVHQFRLRWGQPDVAGRGVS